MNNEKFKKIILALTISFALMIISGCGKNVDNTQTGETQQTESAAYAPFVSQKIYDAFNENDDVVGWLTINGCEIDNRVFQSDNNEHYLRLDESGEYDIWGCYFLDYINIHDGKNLSDKVSIIYGHSMDDDPNNKKFSKLKRYKDEKFAKENPSITLDLLYNSTNWQIFAATDIPVEIDYIDPNPDDEKYAETLNYMIENSYVDCGVDVTTKDQILVLSTCTSDINIRFVVAAVLK